MSSGSCAVCGSNSNLVEDLCADCRFLRSAAKETIKEGSSLGDLRRPFQEAFESSDDTPGDRGPVPVEVDTIRRSKPGAATGKFTLVDKVGSGGVGDVWKAWDHPLHRWVALKFLKAEGEIDIQRFEREARTVGQLNHPHIAPVFEIGMLADHHYIAMQFIEGMTLHEYIRRDERLIAALIRDASLALHYAHEKGVVHRDIKPTNLMVEELGSTASGDTRSRVRTPGHHLYVMDFGLAKQVEVDSSITGANSILGTPAYMSPEQVHGKNDDLDRRTDVYSLGVTLYEMISGRVPFEATSGYELFKSIAEDEPPPPRKWYPPVDRDLETIVLKCMEKNPDRRYQTALKLADDLSRWLEGDAIFSHPPSTVYRVQKFIAKRKPIVALFLVALLAVTALSGFLLIEWSGKRAAERDRILAETKADEAGKAALDLLRRETRYRLDTLLRLRRSGTREGVEEDVKEIQKLCDDVIREYPGLAEPHYIKGRMFRATLMEDLALREQEEAVLLDPGYAPARYERVVLEVQQYRKVLRESLERTRRREVEQVLRGTSERSGKGDLDQDARTELASRRKRLETHLRELEERVRKEASDISRGKLACARGLWLWISGDLSAAKKSLVEALEEDKFLEEGYEALATIEMDADRFEEAMKWWDRGVAVDKGYAPYFEGRGFAHAIHGQSLEGKESQEHYRAAILDFDTALKFRSRSETWMMRGLARQVLAISLFDQRENPGDLFREALEDFDRAVGSEPEAIEPRTGRARVQLVGAMYGRRLGSPQDFRALYRNAIQDLDFALALAPLRAEVWSMRGAAQVEFGMYLAILGNDPLFFFREAREDYRKAIGFAPKWGETWVRLGLLLTHWGVHLEINNDDPRSFWKEGETALSEAIKIDADWAEAWLRRGALRGHIGSYLRNFTKENPTEVIRSAIGDLTKSLELDREKSMGWHYRGSAHFNLARTLERGKKDYRDTYRKAMEDFQKALRMNPALKRELDPLIKDCESRMK